MKRPLGTKRLIGLGCAAPPFLMMSWAMMFVAPLGTALLFGLPFGLLVYAASMSWQCRDEPLPEWLDRLIPQLPRKRDPNDL